MLRLVADGWEPAETARKLPYSERAVRTVLRGVTKRHGFRTPAHAVCYTARAGLL